MRASQRSRQDGVALVVALILLVVITLVGLAGVRGTIMQQKMASNQYDRQIAFQTAEAGLRAAAARIATNPGDIARNCDAGVCLANPFADPNLPSGSIHTVPSGTGTGEFAIGKLAAEQPQFVVENMGKFAAADASTTSSQSPNANCYGCKAGGAVEAVYYRVTVRSGDPATVGDRAVVTLQAMIKQG